MNKQYGLQILIRILLEKLQERQVTSPKEFTLSVIDTIS